MDGNKKSTQQIHELGSEIHRLNTDQDLRNIKVYPTNQGMNKLFREEAEMNEKHQVLKKKILKVVSNQVIADIRSWNNKVNKTRDVSGLFYYLAQIADETVWSSKEALKQLWEQLYQDYRMKIVPLDMQFRISKLINLTINIIAEKGNHA
jgi:hypothetical protein